MNGTSSPPNGRVLTALAGLGVVAAWVIVAIRWSALPLRIPAHFDLHGHVDRYGSRSTLLFLPFLSTAMFVLLAGLQRYPHLYNLPAQKGTRQRAECERLGSAMLRCLALVLCWFMALEEMAMAYTLPPLLQLTLAFSMVPILGATVIVSLVRMQRIM